MRRLVKTALIILILLITPMFAIRPVLAGYQGVHVLVAYDEEFDYTARHRYWYSPEYLAEILITQVSWRFEELFGIKFVIIRFMSWDSNDTNTNDIGELLHECINDTGFYTGMTYNTIPIDILIAFSDQPIINGSKIFYGAADTYLEAVIVTETYLYFSWIQCTDNILQHELSHLYNCPDHWLPNNSWTPKHNCTMNLYSIDMGLDGQRPFFFTTENWCTDCRDAIDLARESLGRYHETGGGPGGPGGPYPLPESGEEA